MLNSSRANGKAQRQYVCAFCSFGRAIRSLHTAQSRLAAPAVVKIRSSYITQPDHTGHREPRWRSGVPSPSNDCLLEGNTARYSPPLVRRMESGGRGHKYSIASTSGEYFHKRTFRRFISGDAPARFSTRSRQEKARGFRFVSSSSSYKAVDRVNGTDTAKSIVTRDEELGVTSDAQQENAANIALRSKPTEAVGTLRKGSSKKVKAAGTTQEVSASTLESTGTAALVFIVG